MNARIPKSRPTLPGRQKTGALLERVRLRGLLFGFLVVFGSVPLLVSALVTIWQNRDALETEEKRNLTRRTELLSQTVGGELEKVQRELEQVAAGLASVPSAKLMNSEARQQWIDSYLERFYTDAQGRYVPRVVDVRRGLTRGGYASPDLTAAVDGALEAMQQGAEVLPQLLDGNALGEVIFVLSEPVRGSDDELLYAIQAALTLPIDVPEVGNHILIDLNQDGAVLWSAHPLDLVLRQSVQRSDVVRKFLSFPRESIPLEEYDVRVGSRTIPTIGQVARLGDSGLAVLVQQPKSTAYTQVRRLIATALYSAAFMVLFALAFAALATRVLTAPIQRLASTAKEIARGNFGKRVEKGGIGFEISDLAQSFNLMSGHVEDHVQKLREAAQVNHALFIGSVRAFLAAIEAKEPYTRGHSERVAAVSQAIALRLGSDREFVERIWIAGLLHDVGKIGIEDRVLNKGDVLTDEEYEEMKRHPVIGEEIMSSIEQLREMLPAIRWHHEKWNGKGYPDGLHGEQIPLIARIVAVADTFDAVTTQRVYQDPFTIDEALGIIKKLDGSGFDPQVVAAFFEAFESGDIEVVDRPADDSRRQVAAEAAPTEAEAVHT